MSEDELYEEIDKFNFVRTQISNEGLDNTFRNYSNFPEIEDEEFHKLRLYYLQHAKLLEEYINKKIDDLEREIDELPL